MPFKSQAQRRFFNANRQNLEKQGVNVDEWNKATGNKKLPEHARNSPSDRRARSRVGKTITEI